MNSIAHIVHALITNNPVPAAELSAAEQIALNELHPLLQTTPQDLSRIAPDANGWTIGVQPDDDRSVA